MNEAVRTKCKKNPKIIKWLFCINFLSFCLTLFLSKVQLRLVLLTANKNLHFL